MANIGVDINTLVLTLGVQCIIGTIKLALANVFPILIFCLDALVSNGALGFALATVERVLKQIYTETVAKAEPFGT